ncbi:acyl carrier protein [Paenibacillus sp. y28]
MEQSQAWSRELIGGQVQARVQELLGPDEAFDWQEDLAVHGLDSMATMNLIIEFEGLFNVAFEDEELLFENFSTIEKMVNRIFAKRVPA